MKHISIEFSIRISSLLTLPVSGGAPAFARLVMAYRHYRSEGAQDIPPKVLTTLYQKRDHPNYH